MRHLVGPHLLLAGLVGLFLLASEQVKGEFIVVPNALEAAEGDTASQFLTGDSRADSVRYQQVFAASQFSGPVPITEIGFRPDAAWGMSFTVTLSNVRIALSTIAKGPDGVSTTFAENVGIDESVVFSGDLVLSSADTAGPGGTQAFDIVIGLSTPFAYNPSLGNLLFDFARDGSSIGQQDGFGFNAEDELGDSIARVFGSRSSPTAELGADSTGLVARFTVPEPSSCAFVAIGFTLLCGRGRNRR
jgi:hypothetical protein